MGSGPRAAPQSATGPACYGPRVAAITVYLYIGQFLSKDRTARALAELFGTPISSGTVAALTARAAGKLDPFLELARKRITASPVVGFDETGFRVDGKLAWVHCARTGKYTLITVHTRRGTKAIEAMGVLPSFAGVAVHDAWPPYDTYTAPDHQLCCAHAQRELQAVTDLMPAGQWCWATQAAQALTTMQTLVAEAINRRDQMVDTAALAEQVTLYRSAALVGLTSGGGTKRVPTTPVAAAKAPTTQASSPSSSPTSSSSSVTTGPVGTTFQVTGDNGPNGTTTTYDVTLGQVDQNATLGPYDSLTNASDHTGGAEFTIKGVTGQSTDDVNSDAVAIGSDTTEYQASFNSITDGGNFNSGQWEAGPGQSVTGWASFEVPAGQTVASVQWQPGIDGTTATWTVSN